MSQEECARLRESVPYVKLYRYWALWFNSRVQVFPLMLGWGPALSNLPLTVWAAEPQWDGKDKCRSIDNQVALTAGVQQIHTYIVTMVNVHQQWHIKYHRQRQREAFTNICRYVHSLLLINFTDTENYTYRLVIHIPHSRQRTHIQSQTGNRPLQ